MPDFVSPDDVRFEAVAAGSGTLFMGIGPADAVPPSSCSSARKGDRGLLLMLPLLVSILAIGPIAILVYVLVAAVL